MKRSKRMATVIFKKPVHLPGFSVKKGEAWRIKKDRVGKEGFTLGGGFVSASDYYIRNGSG